MSNKQETIADIVADIRTQNQGLPEDSYALSPLVCDLLGLADRIEAAHKREVAELTAIINAECRKCGECAKFGKDCISGDIDGAEDSRACEKFVSKEVAELRECLKETMVIAISEYHYHSCFKHVKCGEIERCGTCKVMKWRNALEGGDGRCSC